MVVPRFLLLSGIVLSIAFCSYSEQQSMVREQRHNNYTANRIPLIVRPYTELPLGAIKPSGWLHEQLRLMSQGMTGHLDELYEQVLGSRNGWLGGDGDGWERAPYWLDGLVPLAYILGDSNLIAKTKPWIEWSLSSQTADGYFGPVPFDEEVSKEPGLQKTRRRDWWPKMVMLKVLQQYYNATGDERVIDMMTRYFQFQLQQLPKTPLGHWSFWGNRRGGDNMMVVYWLYNITGDKFLLDLAELLYQQTFPWAEIFLNQDRLSQWNSLHCVNLAQGIKQPVIYYQHHPEDKYLQAVKKAFADIRKFHGQPQGMYGADEGLHGNNPTQGSEFCSAVELMFSLENMLGITGDVEFADHLERIAFNALPTQANDDFSGRQYFQSANQVMLTRHHRNFFTDHNGTDLCFGLFTGYPCCTTNMHQGWPKFTQNLWYATADNGLAAVIFSPCEVNAKVGTGAFVHFFEKTNYPFDDTIWFEYTTNQNVSFPFYLRIPGWCRRAKIRVNGRLWIKAEGGEVIKLDREWAEGDVVELVLPMSISISRWYENSAVVERGPLVYALKIGERWKFVENDDRYGNYYEVYPTDPWNFGLIESYLKDLTNFKVIEKNTKIQQPWNVANAPIEIRTKGKRLPEWQLYNDLPGPLPYSPQKCVSEQSEESITLVPYGCSTLRITEFPVVQ